MCYQKTLSKAPEEKRRDPENLVPQFLTRRKKRPHQEIPVLSVVGAFFGGGRICFKHS